jgi:microcompartment protein CcmK/EutM
MSTLVQWGEVQLLDLASDKLLLRRTVTFRGDNDTAYRRAADFVGDTLKDAMPKQ